MKPYYEADGITIYHGEACATLAQLPEASCDVLLTDPPYSSGGMKGRFRNHLEYVVWGTHGPVDGADDYPSALISVPTVGSGERQHVTEKPVKLLSELLRVVPGERLTVLDPFLGSGSTLVAARNLGHRCIGIEIEERYCEIAANRLAQGVLDLSA